jgi:HK97 gp10 family phage protein
VIKVKWTDNTSKVLDDLQRQGLQFVTEGGQAIRSEMASRAPVRLGNLKGSIQVETFVEDGIPTSETGPTAEYAPYVEYGTGIYAADGSGRKTPWRYKDEEGNWHVTSGQEAQPFAEPGFQAAKPQIDRLAERLLRL